MALVDIPGSIRYGFGFGLKIDFMNEGKPHSATIALSEGIEGLCLRCKDVHVECRICCREICMFIAYVDE